MNWEKNWVIANWKMNGTKEANEKLLHDIQLINHTEVQVGVSVPYPYLFQAENHLKKTDIAIGSEDVSSFSGCGAFTGEVSTEILTDFSVSFALVGHSERRIYFKENNDLLLKKYQNCIDVGIIPLFCVGETLEQRETNQTMKVISSQLSILEYIKNTNHYAIAYEPVWSIGTGKVATVEQIDEVHEYIHGKILSIKSGNASIRLLYGGSVNRDNIDNIIKIQHVNGVLVGGASLDADHFSDIVSSV